MPNTWKNLESGRLYRHITFGNCCERLGKLWLDNAFEALWDTEGRWPARRKAAVAVIAATLEHAVRNTREDYPGFDPAVVDFAEVAVELVADVVDEVKAEERADARRARGSRC